VLGWDGKEKCYTLHWFDSFGNPPSAPGHGEWKGNALVFEHESAKQRGRTIFEPKGEELTFKVEMNVEGKGWNTAVEGRYVRRGRA
jgi:hypothetical protein